MRTFRSRRDMAVAVSAVVLVVLSATLFLLRPWLARAPIVGGWFRADTARNANADTSGRSPAQAPMPAGGPAGMQPPGAGGGRTDPRAEVTIDPRRQQLIGVRTATVKREALDKAIRTVGVVKYDETRLADVNLKIEGWIRDLLVDYTGQLVKKGQPLFTLYSPELLTTQQEYLLTLKTREQVQQSQVADAREYADRLVESARQRLALWDLPPEQIHALETTRQAQTAVTFRAPVSGFVIEKPALQGMHVMPGQTLYKIADLSAVWVEADVYEQEVPLMKVGQGAAVTLDAYPGERFSGRAVYIYPYVEQNTRTVRVRFEFSNRNGRLKPGMYANVELNTPIGVGLVVPSDALLDSGTRLLVFVAEGDGYFQPRDVKVGQRLGDRVQILAGLKEGEQVATGAAFFIDSESQLRASVQGFEAARETTGGAKAREQLEIVFRSQPDPPQTGDNTFEVTVKMPDGQPVADAEVSVTFFMAAMPSMSMPAMKSETKLAPAGNGVYRGAGQVMMAGRWDVTVTVSRSGQRLGRKQIGVVAR